MQRVLVLVRPPPVISASAGMYPRGGGGAKLIPACYDRSLILVYNIIYNGTTVNSGIE